MTYVMVNGTGSHESRDSTPVEQTLQEAVRESFRILTDASPIPNLRYKSTLEVTDQVQRSIPASPPRPRKTHVVNTAEREHVSRLLRNCQQISQDLLSSNEPIESALLGGQLTNILHELWNHRKSREADWIEILNVLQIAVPAEEFEFLPKEKRLALVRIFTEGLLTRTIGASEVDRSLKLLTEAGFDVWRGLSDEHDRT